MLLETNRDLLRRLEQELRQEAEIDLQVYDVMVHVSEGEEGRRMSDLADAIVLSKSGLTAVVDRLEQEGLVERRADPHDRRVIRVHLTPEGERRFTEASRHHRAVVRKLFTSHLSDDDARTLVEVLGKVRAALAQGERP